MAPQGMSVYQIKDKLGRLMTDLEREADAPETDCGDLGGAIRDMLVPVADNVEVVMDARRSERREISEYIGDIQNKRAMPGVGESLDFCLDYGSLDDLSYHLEESAGLISARQTDLERTSMMLSEAIEITEIVFDLDPLESGDGVASDVECVEVPTGRDVEDWFTRMVEDGGVVGASQTTLRNGDVQACVLLSDAVGDR